MIMKRRKIMEKNNKKSITDEYYQYSYGRNYKRLKSVDIMQKNTKETDKIIIKIEEGKFTIEM